jgi:hypothetical protein
VAENQPQKKIPLVFYRLRPGHEPVREWLKNLTEVERHAIGKDLLRAQWRWPVGMPFCRPLGNGLWEIRNRPANETNCARAALPLPRAPGRAPRIYQENAHDAG